MIAARNVGVRAPVALVNERAIAGQATSMYGTQLSLEESYQQARPGFQDDFAAHATHTGDAGDPERTFAQAEPNYRAGFMAGHDLHYEGRTFAEVEPDLRHEYESSITDDGERTTGDAGWESLREEIRTGFHTARNRLP